MRTPGRGRSGPGPACWVGRRGWTEEGGEVRRTPGCLGLPTPGPWGSDAWKAVADTCGVGPRPTPGAHAPHALLPLEAGGTCDWLLTKSDGCT